MNNVIYLFNTNRNNKIDLFKDYILNSNKDTLLNFLNYFFDSSLDTNSNISFNNKTNSDSILNCSFYNYENSIIMNIDDYTYIMEFNINCTTPTINLFKEPIKQEDTKSISINIPKMVIIELNKNPFFTTKKNIELNFNNNYFSFNVPVFNLFNENIATLKEKKLNLLLHFKSN